MAERRMFSKAITQSARFLRMPATARLLYYDLGMAADDEGVVEAFTVMRTTGATEAELQSLADKGFIQILNEDLVSYITHWRENNWIRADRKRPSVYAKLLQSEKGFRQTDDRQSTAQDRIAEDRTGKENSEQQARGSVSFPGINYL